MMWICICRCHNHVTAALVGQAFKIFPGFLVTLREGKPELTAVIEAIDPFKWAPISISNTYEVFHNLHMLWMFICTCLYHVTATLLCQAFGISQGFWLPHGGQPKVHCSDWGYRPILSNTYNFFHNLHMMWMFIYICPYHVTADASVGKALESHLDFGLPPGGHIAV
jgi:hypothetical protein